MSNEKVDVVMSERDKQFIFNLVKQGSLLNFEVSDAMHKDPSAFVMVINSIILDRKVAEQKIADLFAENQNLNKVIELLQNQVNSLQTYLMEDKLDGKSTTGNQEPVFSGA